MEIIHPSIMMNRIGVYYAKYFTKNPKTLLEKCVYFRITGKVLPHQTISDDVLSSMKKNAEEFYRTLTAVEKEELSNYYGALPAEWR